jgi:hypothetical protein
MAMPQVDQKETPQYYRFKHPTTTFCIAFVSLIIASAANWALETQIAKITIRTASDWCCIAYCHACA